MPAYKLTYFDFDGGRGEPARIAFHAAGVEFEDHRVSFPEFQELRGSLRFNALPVLYVDGVEVSQSNAMNRYIGKLAGLYPKDDLQAMYCDEVLDVCEELTLHTVATFGLEGDELKAAREKLVAGKLSLFIRGLEQLLERGGGEYFAGGQLTMADIRAFLHVRWLRSGGLDHVPTDIVETQAPMLAAHASKVEQEPPVANYYAGRA